MAYNHNTYLRQVGLKKLGFDPGPLDGFDGPKTRKATSASAAKRFGSKKEATSSTTSSSPKSGYPPRPLPNTNSKKKVFGPFGVKGGRSPKMGYFKPPYDMTFSWGGKVSRIGCHHLIKTPLENALKEIAQKGSAWIKKYGLHLYAGCYAPRKSRAGSSMSDHAWAIAIDVNPDGNKLHQTWRPGRKNSNGTYEMPKEAVRIFAKHGFKVGIRRSNGTRRDMMHIAYVNRS